jgi:hypothetical protein
MGESEVRTVRTVPKVRTGALVPIRAECKRGTGTSTLGTRALYAP